MLLAAFLRRYSLCSIVRQRSRRSDAHQQRLGVQGLVELELLALWSAVELEEPACVLEVLESAWGLHDPVERDVLGCDDSSRLGTSLPRRVWLLII